MDSNNKFQFGQKTNSENQSSDEEIGPVFAASSKNEKHDKVMSFKGGPLQLDDESSEKEAINANSDELDLNSEEERVLHLLQQMHKVFEKPVLTGHQTTNFQHSSPYLAELGTVKVEFELDEQNLSAITNPRGILEVFDPSTFLRSGLSEQSQCQIID